MNKVTILGINGSIGHHAARAFVKDGWDVVGFGRSNKQPVEGVRFHQGDANNVGDMQAAIGDADVVVNALNLPYDKWFDGRLEAQMQKVIAAMGKNGKTLLFPGNVYNYAASQRVMLPESAQRPETARGALRVVVEDVFKAAAEREDFQVLVIRAGDFYSPETRFDYMSQIILREGKKGKLARPGAPETGHAWAYLPDLAQAFLKVAQIRQSLARFETFHFAGHFVTHGEMMRAIRQAAPIPLQESPFPWWMLRLVGLVSPVMAEVVKMKYLWDNPMELRDRRLEALLGPDFGTRFEHAVGEVVRVYFQ